jgi:hypothetical protein
MMSRRFLLVAACILLAGLLVFLGGAGAIELIVNDRCGASGYLCEAPPAPPEQLVAPPVPPHASALDVPAPALRAVVAELVAVALPPAPRNPS